MKKVDILKDEETWLMIGSEELAEKYGIDWISKEDFINGAVRKDSLGVEGGEKEKEG